MAVPVRRVLAPLLALLCAGCGAASTPPTSVGTPVPATSTLSTQPLPSAATPSAASPPVRVAVIVMENRGYDSVVGLPYIRSLETASSVLTNYHASSHPSLPNYLALTSGSTWGIADDGYHVLPRVDVGDQLTTAGVPWRAYMESMTGSCLSSGGGYAVKHDPFAYYGGSCPPSVAPFSDLSADLAGASVPRFLWITPNLCDDMHDCSSSTGDDWLRRVVPSILNAPAMNNGVLFITWDENDGGGSNQVLTLVLGSRTAATPAAAYSHPSLLATVEDLLGLPRLPVTAHVPAIALR